MPMAAVVLLAWWQIGSGKARLIPGANRDFHTWGRAAGAMKSTPSRLCHAVNRSSAERVCRL